MNLSKNFTLKELTATSTGLVNEPSASQIEKLKTLVINILQPLRDKYGKAIRVTSGFRSAAVNSRVRGSRASQHCKAEAADIVCVDNSEIFSIIRDELDFDQLIWEKGNDVQPVWVHVSFKNHGNRKQVLKFKNGRYTRM